MPVEPALTWQKRGKEGFVAGMGNMKYKAPEPPCTMHEARIKMYDDEACRKMVDKAEEAGEGAKIVNAFCAGYLEGGIDACQGDSGGPLMIEGNYGEVILLGVTSFGYDCALKDMLGMYTDVSQYLDWLRRKTNMTLTDARPAIPNQATTTTPEFKPPTPNPNATAHPLPPFPTNTPGGDQDDSDDDDDDGDDDDSGSDSGTTKPHQIVIPIQPPTAYYPSIVINIHKKKKKKPGHHGKHHLHHLLHGLLRSRSDRTLTKDAGKDDHKSLEQHKRKKQLHKKDVKRRNAQKHHKHKGKRYDEKHRKGNGDKGHGKGV